ncbi:MAG: hypothetical protein U5L04_13660 [Trueperaceae bacterium]|nr:hypothetical protein [Trueperaceae bacterium]
MTYDEQRIAEGFLFTDMYQLTMAQLYFRAGLHERRARFDHFFRDNPDYGTHQAGYSVNAGLGWLLDWMAGARVTDADLDVLRAQRGRGGEQVFGEDFLTWLKEHGDFRQLTLRAVPEGRVVHPHTPVTVVEGPLALGADPRDGAARTAQLSDSGRDQGGADPRQWARTAAARVRGAAGARPGRECGGAGRANRRC